MHINAHSSSPKAGQIIEADMREFYRAGHSIRDYTEDHVIDALLSAGIDPRKLPYTPYELMMAVLEDRCRRALEQ
jgi:hypothetical protein